MLFFKLSLRNLYLHAIAKIIDNDEIEKRLLELGV